jgi:hypothetical protein
MRAFMRSLVVCTSLFLSFGCGTRDAGAPAPAQADDRFERRFLEVVRIPDEGKRQEALAQIATEAAEAGDTANTWKALGWMKDPSGRDVVARSCALKLAALGKRDDATLIASHQINNADLRDKTRAEVGESKSDK